MKYSELAKILTSADICSREPSSYGRTPYVDHWAILRLAQAFDAAGHPITYDCRTGENGHDSRARSGRKAGRDGDRRRRNR